MELGVQCDQITENLDTLRLGENIRQVDGTLDVHQDKDEASDIIPQALRITKNVLRLAEGHWVIRQVNTALRVSAQSRGRCDAVAQIAPPQLRALPATLSCWSNRVSLTFLIRDVPDCSSSTSRWPCRVHHTHALPSDPKDGQWQVFCDLQSTTTEPRVFRRHCVLC